jgi:6,7-dimethyl-8-ribityllumazine synthase
MASTSSSNPLPASSTTGAGRRIGIVAARWHGVIVDALLDGAVQTLTDAGVHSDDIVVVRCPGSYEIPVCVKSMAQNQRVDAVIALGVVIRGDTAHFEYVSSPVAHSLMDIAVETGVPCMFGVLTTDTVEQAEARAGGVHGNKGSEAAVGALEMADVMDRLRSKKP